jgi:pyruvate dehydrogenase E2 component (dihydrolipoamide acetyltransferase)
VSEEQSPPGGPARARGEVEVVELTAAQQSFARRAAESKATAPHVYFEQAIDAPPDLASLIAGSAVALRELPVLNGAYRDGRIELYSRVNVAFGVETTETLLFPVLHDADRLDGSAIAARVEELRAAADGGTLASPALAGATFTLIDMSPRGVARFTPTIARGQAATLGVGTGGLVLACDNRIVQAGEGAEFLGRLTAMLD